MKVTQERRPKPHAFVTAFAQLDCRWEGESFLPTPESGRKAKPQSSPDWGFCAYVDDDSEIINEVRRTGCYGYLCDATHLNQPHSVLIDLANMIRSSGIHNWKLAHHPRRRHTTYRSSTSDMPSAAFVAGAAVQNAHNASLIAQQAATVAEQQTLEANQARHYASFAEAQATQALQQAEATLLETRAKAEAYVAQAEANVRNTQQQAQAFAASVDQEREQFQAQLNSRAQQWARGVEADARLRVQQLQHQTEQYMSAQQDTVRNLQQHNAVLEQQLLAERSPVPNSPKSPMTQILTGSQLSTPVMAYGKDPCEGNPFAVSMQLEPPPGLLPQDAQPSLPLTPKGSHRPQEYYIGSVRGTPPGSVAPADGHAGQVASLEAQVSSLQDTVKLLAGHLQSLLSAPKTMTPSIMSSGSTIGVPVPPPPPPPTMLMPPPPPPLPPHAAAPVPGTAAADGWYGWSNRHFE